jgi:ABC-type transporter Mla MlaB component
MADDPQPDSVAVVHLDGALDVDALARLDARIRALVAGGVRTVTCDATGAEVDLAVVNALARLHLAGRAAGCQVRVGPAGPALAALLDLVGLTDVLEIDP